MDHFAVVLEIAFRFSKHMGHLFSLCIDDLLYAEDPVNEPAAGEMAK